MKHRGYNTILKFGRYKDLTYDFAVIMCVEAIISEKSPWAFLYHTDSGELVREFFPSSVTVLKHN